MTRSDIDRFLAEWWQTDSKVFRYKQAFVGPEYVVFYKTVEGKFKTDDKHSTYIFEAMEVKKFSVMVYNGELEYISPYDWTINTLDLKTGSCECGAWATITPSNPYVKHDRSCKLYRTDQ